jgi:hypothetical protein
MVNGPDYNVVQGFDKLWQQASIHDVENGQTRGINKEEFDGMSLFLNEAIKNPNATAETKNWAQKKLDDLKVMKDSVFNKDQLKKDVEANSPKGLWDNIKDCFTKTEKDYREELSCMIQNAAGDVIWQRPMSSISEDCQIISAKPYDEGIDEIEVLVENWNKNYDKQLNDFLTRNKLNLS